jgi:hypothetical protein
MTGYLKSYELLSASHATMVTEAEAEAIIAGAGLSIAACNLPG